MVTGFISIVWTRLIRAWISCMFMYLKRSCTASLIHTVCSYATAHSCQCCPTDNIYCSTLLVEQRYSLLKINCVAVNSVIISVWANFLMVYMVYMKDKKKESPVWAVKPVGYAFFNLSTSRQHEHNSRFPSSIYMPLNVCLCHHTPKI